MEMEKPCITGLCVLMRSLGNSEVVAVNHWVRGSSPCWGAKQSKPGLFLKGRAFLIGIHLHYCPNVELV